MERLTKETIGCFKYTLKDHKVKVGDFGEYDAFFDYSMAVKRLGEYEDTGLTPEQIQAQQQEINKFRTERDMEVSKTNKLYAEIRALTADKDEQAGRITKLEKVAKDLYFAYINKDPDFPHSFETQATERYKALLGGAEDEQSTPLENMD